LLEPIIDLSEGFKVTIWRPSAQATAQAGAQAGAQVSEEVKRVLLVMNGEMKSADIQAILQLKHRGYFKNNYLDPSIDEGFVEMTIPESSKSPNQMYRLTEKGIEMKKLIVS